MLPELGRIGPLTIRTYTLLLDLAIVAGLGVLAWYGRRVGEDPTHWVDVGLGGLVGGLFAGRLGHVVIHWAYFSQNQAEILQIWRGGIDWHAALLGGLAGLALASRLRGIRFEEVTDVLTPFFPFAVVLIYAGCLSTSCGHGAEVVTLSDYPAWAVAELPDLYGVMAPRFATQLYGVALGVLLIGVMVLLANTVRRDGLRLWILIALLALGTFGIGFTRGDAVPQVGLLRLDQVLDLAIAALALGGAALTTQPEAPPKPELPDRGAGIDAD